MEFILSTSFIPISDILELAPVADQTGWHGVSFSDHVVHPKQLNTPYPYTENGERRWPEFTEWPDPFVMIGALSSITTHLRFMNNVYVLPMRNVFQVAKTVATAALASNNRVNLCIGVGWSKDEFLLMEQDFHTRGKRCNEMIEVLHKLWRGGWVEHHGQFYDFAPLEMSPAPTAPIPIWVGGISDAALKRAARLGDGWISDLQSSEDIISCVKKLKQYRQEFGRDHLPFEVMATPNDAFLIDQYKRLEEHGITHILTMPWPMYYGDTNDLDKKKDAVKRYSDDVIRVMK
jgi:probable F420-dependent oxidoreductase